ncbi:MAG: 6-phosphogluconolactonase [Sulfuricella sp.]|nr:6-phosphogluconolactonase [Sulfuricella sp.]
MAQRTVTSAAQFSHGDALNPELRWHVLPDADAVRDRALDWIRRSAAEAIALRGAFHIVLAGGTTPRAVYQSLRNEPQEWSKWHVWFGDERCLLADDTERNSRMAHAAWLDQVAIPVDQIHDMPGELGAEQGALAYAEALKNIAEFDLVLLGLGEDGHTASLFPGHQWGIEKDAPAVLAVHRAPKPPPERISLSAWRLSGARRVVFMVTGIGKREAVARWRAGEALPVTAICPANGGELLVEEAVVQED